MLGARGGSEIKGEGASFDTCVCFGSFMTHCADAGSGGGGGGQ